MLQGKSCSKLWRARGIRLKPDAAVALVLQARARASGPVDPANGSRRRDTRQETKRGAGHLASGRLRPEPQAVTDVAGDAFCHAELRVCGIDRSGVRT